MKFITWLKSLSMVVILGAIGAAIMMVLNARRAGKLEVKVEHQENHVKELNEGTKADIQAAAKMQEKIRANKIKAREIRKKSEASLERIGTDEAMADIMDRFNNKSGRVRSRADSAAGLSDS